MTATVIETPTYLRAASRLLSEAERDDLRLHLAENAAIYPVIAGTAGLRKSRWQQKIRGKGKRGGVRVIYFHALSASKVFLLDIIRKKKRAILAMAIRKSLKAACEAIKRALSSEPVTPKGRRLLRALQEVDAHLSGEVPPREYRYTIPNPVGVRSIRAKTGLSQSDFAQRFAIELRTLQDWEQGRRTPDAAVRAYLTVIERQPDAVTEALSA